MNEFDAQDAGADLPLPPGYSLDVRAPADASTQYLAEFARLVRKGAEVNPQTLDQLINNSLALVSISFDREMIAVGGAKRPDLGYRKKVFQRAGLQDPGRFPYEIGWVYVEEAHTHRGLSSAILRALLVKTGDAWTYATSVSTKEFMHRSLIKSGFRPVGCAYSSNRRDDQVLVFIRQDPRHPSNAVRSLTVAPVAVYPSHR